MNWRDVASEILTKIKSFREDTEGWQFCKKSSDATVWCKPSPDWKGTLYKAEGIIASDPETVFSYVEPTPTGPRVKWDKAIKELQIVEQIDKSISILRTITHSAFGGLISSRDFVDLIVNENTPDHVATNARGVEHPGCPPTSECVRGNNYTCAIVCGRIAGEPNQTRVTTFIQTDLAGLLPTSLVDNALPSNQLNFFTSLSKALREGGLIKTAGSV